MGGATMSLAEFLRRLDSAKVSKNDHKWFPKWLAGYAQFHRFHDSSVSIETSLVLSFLRSLRDSRIPAWRRLQATRALETYQELVLRKHVVDFHPIRIKLHELSRRESLQAGLCPDDAEPRSQPGSDDFVPGEGNAGITDASEPKVILRMRQTLRTLHHPRSTETAYVGWIRRLIRHLDDECLEQYGERDIADFLTDLAVTHDVTAGTQNQALSACLFLSSTFQRPAQRCHASTSHP
jgi:hypothetical protein